MSLFVGIWLGWTFLAGNPIAGLADALECCIDVFKDGGNTKVIAFSGLVGALIAFTQHSGGVQGFVNWLSERKLADNRRKAGLLAFAIGAVIFIESNITCLVTGTVSRPIFDRLKISREKLAYICDSTSAPICIMIPLNGWGAYIIGLLTTQNVAEPFPTLLKSLPFNFYAIFAILLLLGVIITGRDFGPMRKAEKRAQEEGKLLRDGAEPVVSTELLDIAPKPGVPVWAGNMLIPIITMMVMMPIGLLITGDGDLMRGSGSTSVFWAVLAGVGIAGILYGMRGIMNLKEQVELLLKGISGMMPIALLMMFAFAIGATCKEMGTGMYVANVTESWLSPKMVPAIVFMVSAFVAFSTGTSWGTFAIMLPIGIPMVGLMGAPLHATIGAVLSGGVFGDHCSPISDTTIVSSMASASDHIDHVRTQLPYALLAGLVAILFYLMTGLLA